MSSKIRHCIIPLKNNWTDLFLISTSHVYFGNNMSFVNCIQIFFALMLEITLVKKPEKQPNFQQKKRALSYYNINITLF